MWCIFALLSAITAAYLLGATFVFASPACQDASPYNTADSKGTTERATLFVDTLKNIEAVGYKAGIIENVPE
jgi:site-specific DNA-cytosine methylase